MIAGVIGIPSLGMVSTHFLASRAMLQGDLGISWVDKIVLDDEMRSKGLGVDIGSKKQYIAEYAVEQGAEWVLFLDDDVIFPPNTLIQLLHRNKDIVGGVYWSKSHPPRPLIFKGHMRGTYLNWHAGDFIKVDAMGMGLTLIKTKVFKAMEKPWFTLNYTYQEIEDKTKRDFGTTEDLYFYKKAKDYGFETWCDTSIQAFHFEKNSKQFFGLQSDYPQAIPASDIKPRGKKLIADIGCGENSPYFQEGIPVRFDIREEANPDVVCDIRSIPEPAEKYDIVYSSHALEHFSHKGVIGVLKEWLRILKTGGELRLILPNLEWACQQVAKTGEISWFANCIFYGEQNYPKNFHASGFTQKVLHSLLEATGCLNDIIITTDGDGKNLLAHAIKFKHNKDFESIHPKYSLKGGMHMEHPELSDKKDDSMEKILWNTTLKQNKKMGRLSRKNKEVQDLPKKKEKIAKNSDGLAKMENTL